MFENIVLERWKEGHNDWRAGRELEGVFLLRWERLTGTVPQGFGEHVNNSYPNSNAFEGF